MQKNKQYYDDFFSQYPVDIHDNADRFLAVVPLLSGRCLDVACGTGTLADYFSGYYMGVDISDVAIESARKMRRKDARFRAFDFNASRMQINEKFDCAYLGEFLEHIDNDDFVFQNLLGVLKSNARIVVSVPNGERVPDESHCRTFSVPEIRRQYGKYGKIRFHNWSGFSERILFSIEIGVVDVNLVSLVMIVKDEAKGIENAILSALPFVNRVVVSVDESSTDNTLQIAKLYADELRTHKWADDFSKARNEASVNVDSKWILFLDGHEYIESFGKVPEKLAADVDGIFVTVRMESGMTFLYPRIYRAGLQFKNAVHNLVECVTKIADPSFVIVHDRDNLQSLDASERRNKQRDEMLPKFLKQQLKENPENARAHFHLANYYLMKEDLKLALKHYKKTIKYSKMADEAYLSYLTIGRIHFNLGNNMRAFWAFNRADLLIPNRWETARVIGGFYFLHEHWEKAVDWLVKALGQNSRHYSYEPMKQNLPEIWEMIGNCFYKIGQYEKTLIAWKRAHELVGEQKAKDFLAEKIALLEDLISG